MCEVIAKQWKLNTVANTSVQQDQTTSDLWCLSMVICLKPTKNNSAHKSPGYHFLLEHKIRGMSGFNNGKSVHVTLDPLSINVEERKKGGFYRLDCIQSSMILAEKCFLCKAPQCLAKLLLIYSKTTHIDFMYSWKMFKDDRRLSNNDISSTSVLYNRWKLLNLSPDHSWVVCSEFFIEILLPLHTVTHYHSQQPEFYELHSSAWDRLLCI